MTASGPAAPQGNAEAQCEATPGCQPWEAKLGRDWEGETVLRPPALGQLLPGSPDAPPHPTPARPRRSGTTTSSTACCWG